MKVKHISSKKLERLMNSVRIQPQPKNKYVNAIKNIRQPEFDARLNFERYAEEMEPQEYLKIRKYLSSIEMQDLYKYDI